MTRYFMQSWKSHLCDQYLREGDEGGILCETSSAKFAQLRVMEGDQIYAVFVRDGKLFLIGKMEVGRFASSWKEVVDLVGPNVYRGVKGAKYSFATYATRMSFNREMRIRVVKSLRFVSNRNPRLKFVDNGKLDRQTMRNLRELTQQSAALLDSFLSDMEKVELNL